jgi:4-hydroxy-tetrahydrodipicolinate reductase
MNIAIIGYGKMGKIIECLALGQEHRIVAAVDPLYGKAQTLSGAPVFKTIQEIALGRSNATVGSNAVDSIDVALEFTRPDTALANIKALADARIPVVVGTTGWLDKLEEARAAVNAAGSSLLWASNFSLGVNIFYRIAFNAAILMDPFDEYDVGGFEAHHNKKADSPSGTAKTLTEGIIKRMKRKETPVYETLARPPLSGELHFPSLRLGSLPGVHSLMFDSPADTIEIRHTARGREGFASGALTAAQWLVNCPGAGQAAGSTRQGIFTMDDVLDELGVKNTK